MGELPSAKDWRKVRKRPICFAATFRDDGLGRTGIQNFHAAKADVSQMPEEVRLSPDGKYIAVTSSGPPSLSEMAETLAKIAELQRSRGVRKVLVDSRARSGQPPVVDLFRGGEMLAEQLGPGVRVAVLVSERSVDHQFFETVSLNRGALVAYFEHEDEARRWLLEADANGGGR